MMSSNAFAMTAPGSQPVDPLPPAKDQGDPAITVSGRDIPVGTDGKPQAAKQAAYNPPRPAWGPATTPDVIRET